jgi:isopropylmalate/homocitrate/citramalate synthase
LADTGKPTVPEMVGELYTVILGVKGTSEKGMVGKINKMESQLSDMNGVVKANTAWRKAHTWLIFSIILTLLAMIVRLFVGW